MKKWMCLLLAGVLLLSITACKKPAASAGETGNTESMQQQANENAESTGEDIDYKTKYPVLYQSGECYAVYTNNEPVAEFYYIVTDQNGNLLDQGIKDYRGSIGFSYRNGLLVMNYGVGGSTRYERYYDVKSGYVSDSFLDPVASSGSLVAYFGHNSDNEIILTVQDIFDESAYCVQIPGTYSDFVFKNAGIYKGEFLEDNTKLKFTYPVGDKGETVTQTVNLPGRSAGDKRLLQVLHNQQAFVDESGKSVCLKDYKVYGSQDAVVEKYAWVDFDGDGCNELVAYLASDLAYLVFRMENDRVYGFEMGIRALMSLNADGTYVGSGGATLQSFLSLRFKDGKYEQYELAYKDDSPGKEECRVGGKSVTAEEFAVFYQEFESKPDAVWYSYTAPAEQHSLATG